MPKAIKENWEKELLELCFELKDRTFGSHYRVLVKFIRQLLLAEQKWVEEIEKELPDQYEDKKLGRTDLTLNEMFERGYNSCLIQIWNKLEKLKKGRIT